MEARMTATSRDRLDTYRDRRDFRKTPEPSGERPGGPRFSARRNPIFVVHEHDARSRHWDLRLEVDGALRSWAVPRGPPTDPREKRLAVATEDHPLEYADFEGVIPAGEYGAGTVTVWDAGPYRNLSTDDDGREVPIAEALDRGAAEVWLEGKKLRGGYALIHGKLGGKQENWLLVKMKDAGADARRNPTSTEPHSVLSGRTQAEVAEDAAADDGDDGDGA
jgi:DNA ligase D-like protein (predicted 3'-phosphoesterase)